MVHELISAVKNAVSDLYGVDVSVELSRTEEQFGDYASNVALKLSKQLEKKPVSVAEELVQKLKTSLGDKVSDVSVAGPGFINFTLQDQTLLSGLEIVPSLPLKGQNIVAEYSDPNPFKVLHAGHLYTSLVGDSVSNLMEYGGAQVHRVNFGGDVGLHVGRTMWALLKDLGGEYPDKLQTINPDHRLDWLSQMYVTGTAAYEENETAKAEITDLNKRVYEIHKDNDKDSPFASIYWTCRQWSYEGFDALYKQLEMKPFEKYYPESAVSSEGLDIVKQNTGTVYEKSGDAVIFNGEKFGLFTQVFINSEGLPTYAGKDVGLIFQKNADFAPSQSFIFTDIAQKDHLAVVMKSISLFAPELVATTTHFAHGQIKMAGGVKMSSRKGNILRASDILNSANEASKNLSDKENPRIVLAAVKYSFLKNRIGGDIVYDPSESVSLEGNSGPYLQYAYARASSILRKADTEYFLADDITLEAGERSLVRKITEFNEVTDKAVNELMPHYVATYLYELAQTFNRFYEDNRVVGDPRQQLRLVLINKYASILKTGLKLLGIASLEKM